VALPQLAALSSSPSGVTVARVQWAWVAVGSDVASILAQTRFSSQILPLWPVVRTRALNDRAGAAAKQAASQLETVPCRPPTNTPLHTIKMHSAATRTGSAAPITTVTSSPLDALSSELVKAVASLADIKTVGNFGCTSKQLRHICSAVLGSPAYMRSVQSVLATHVIVLKDGRSVLPEAVDASANPGPYTVRTTAGRQTATSGRQNLAIGTRSCSCSSWLLPSRPH
jgi:hypothetical protein